MFPFPSLQCAGGRLRITTWDPAHKGAALTLSNGNLTATGNGTANLSARATTSLTAGVRVVRHTYTATSGAYFGFCNASFNTASTATLIGDDANSVRYNPANGQVTLNGSVLSTVATAAVGDAVDVAIDLTNRSMWVRVNGGNWNNNAGGNPATNAVGISVSSLTGPLFPATTVIGVGGASETATFYGVALASGINMWDE